MAKRIQVQFEGRMVAADQLDFEPEKEPWTVYKVEDGTILRLKTVLGTVSRLVDNYKPNGEPIYVLGIAGIPMMDINPDLHRPPAEQKAEKE